MTAFIDGAVDRVEIIYNGYVSPLTQRVDPRDAAAASAAAILGEDDEEPRAAKRRRRAMVEYEPEADEILLRSSCPLRRDLDLPGAARIDRPPSMALG
jgi:F-type H+-transporting ATPase subunit gamma